MRSPVGSCLRAALSVATLFYVTMTMAKGPAASDRASDRLVVHEWGTFTSLHDENGKAIAGINADDEPVPQFVHRIADFLVIQSGSVPALAQGAPHCHPDVTMRLETPVVYFHPPRDAELPMSVDVEVAFPGGWLSEFYPAAEVDAPGVKGHMSFGAATDDTVGRLRWNDLQIGTEGAGPKTDSHVWLAPRAVKAANVTTTGGESERYLFYRGVGRVESPLRVSRDPADQSLVVTANFASVQPDESIQYTVPAMWLVEIREDTSCAYRTLDGFQFANGDEPKVVARTAGHFEASDFDKKNFTQLLADMRAALIADGLFTDEANALLGTWKQSYFQTPGLRLFYLLPREWTDRALPMRLSQEADIVRTMVGRVEIVTPEQRQLLSRIAAGPASTTQWMFSCAAVNVPEDYSAYQRLGRFRNALLLDELNRRPTPALKDVVTNYGLWGFSPSNSASATAPAKK